MPPATASSSPESSTPHLRASDRDREDVIAALREHAAQGRLDIDELSERLDAAHAARTHAELEGPVRDLPSLTPARRRHARRAVKQRELAGHARVYALVMVLLVAIWLVSGAGYFWPVWPLLGWGIGLGSHGAEVMGVPRLRRPALP